MSSGKYKNNDDKMDYLLDIWYAENFDKSFIGKTNLDLNGIVEMTKPGTNDDYFDAVSEKQTPKISQTQITLNNDQPCLKTIFWNNTGCYDLSNYQSNIINNQYRDTLKSDIESVKTIPGKTIVVMSNVIGKEWQINNLRTAVITIAPELTGKIKDKVKPEDIDIIRRIYYGLKKRKERLINDIKFCLNNGADEVYLMKGLEEFKVLKETKVDVFADVIKSLGSDKVFYISEGTMTKVNLIKKNKGKASYYNICKFASDNDSKSINPAIMEKPSEVRTKELPDVTFALNGNYTAAIRNDNIFYPSGQLNFLNSVKGKNPDHMVNNGNILLVYPEGNHDLTVVRGGRNLYEQNAKIINEKYLETKKSIALAEIIEERTEAKKREIMARPILVVNNTKNIKNNNEEK